MSARSSRAVECTGDRHAIVIDAATCRLYETWNTRLVGRRWMAGSGATWSLLNKQPATGLRTSADAAGPPILPGLLRYDEVLAGRVDHAIRFTTNRTSRAYVRPARHQAEPPMTRPIHRWGPVQAEGQARPPATRRKPARCSGDEDLVSCWLTTVRRGFQGTSDTRWRNGSTNSKRIPGQRLERWTSSRCANSAAVSTSLTTCMGVVSGAQ